MGGSARPSILRGDCDHPCPDRIEFDVAQCCPEMRVIQRTGIEPPLPDMAAGRLPGIPVSAVASVGMLEGLCKCLGGARHSNQMDVIGHQAVAEQRHAIEFTVPPQQFQVRGARGVIIENHLLRVTALRNMMRDVNHHDPRKSSHDRKVSEKSGRWSAT